MITNATLRYPIEDGEVVYDTNHDIVNKSTLWSDPIPCHITYQNAKLVKYIGGEDRRITATILVEGNLFNGIDVSLLGGLQIRQEKTEEKVHTLQYVEWLPYTQTYKLYI